VEVPLGGWDVHELTRVFHEGVELPAGDRRAPLREKERGGMALPRAEVGLEGRDLIGAPGLDPRQGALHAADGQPLLRKVQVVHLQ
jgi:hypothetical protein